jgi:hypothetical protein
MQVDFLFVFIPIVMDFFLVEVRELIIVYQSFLISNAQLNWRMV